MKQFFSCLIIALVGIVYYQAGWMIVGNVFGLDLVPLISLLVFPMVLSIAGFYKLSGDRNQRMVTLMLGFFPVLVLEAVTREYWQPIAILAGCYFFSVLMVWFTDQLLSKKSGNASTKAVS